jgi:hypothetical protein
MSPISHLLLAWVVANAFSLNLRERRLCLIIGVISDVDGVFILFSQDLFITYHHTLGHWLIFGIPLALLFAIFTKKRIKAFLVFSLAFILHLVADIVGTNWSVHPFEPFSSVGFSAYPTLSNHFIYFRINPIVFIFVFIVSVYIWYKFRRTPWEFISKKWDLRLSNFPLLPLKEKCEFCGNRGYFICEKCKKIICTEHVNTGTTYLCNKCKQKDKPG